MVASCLRCDVDYGANRASRQVQQARSAFLKKSAQKTFAGGLGQRRCLFNGPVGAVKETPALPQPARKSFFGYFFFKKSNIFLLLLAN